MTEERQAREELRKRVPAFAEKVEPLYQLLNWKWGGIGIPSKRDIEETLYRLLDNLGDSISTSTGGLMVGRDRDERCFYMKFTVSDKVWW